MTLSSIAGSDAIGTGGGREAIHVRYFRGLPRQEFRYAPEENLAEAFGRMQQHLFQNVRSAQQRQAAKFMRGIYGQNEVGHFSN